MKKNDFNINKNHTKTSIEVEVLIEDVSGMHKLLQEVIALKAYEKSLARIEIQKKLKQL